jgi:quercetin dioxygenase-like cupin family protein
MEPDAARLFEAHLEACVACRAEVIACRESWETLGRAATPVAPPAHLKAKLLERIGDGAPVQAWKRWSPNLAGDASVIVRAGSSGWEPTGSTGIDVRRLFVDAAAERITMLVRMAPGTCYPSHRHAGVEECYVLEGDLYSDNFEMKAGDYQRLEGGTAHGVQATHGGCLLFIVSSMHDELLPGRK